MPDAPPVPPTPPPESGLGDGAAITPDDLERAKIAWKRAAPKQFQNLLDATPDDSAKP